VTVATGDGSVLLSDIDIDPDHAGPYSYVNIYRRDTSSTSTDYNFVDQVAVGTNPGDVTTYQDVKSDTTVDANPPLDTDTLTGKYSYYVTYANSSGVESRPDLDLKPSTVSVVNGRVTLTHLPTVDPNDNPDKWTVRRVYRCLASDNSKFYYVGEIPDATSDVTFTDSIPDDTLVAQDVLLPNGGLIDLDGPKINSGTKLLDVLRRDGETFDQVFKLGTLHLTGQKGGNTLATKDFTIIAASTVQDLYDFMSQAMGIQKAANDPTIPDSETDVPGIIAHPGGDVDAQGRVNLTGNNGVANAIGIQLSGLTETYTDTSGQVHTETVNLPFTSFQTAVGESATTDTVVYDSLGTSLSLRMTAVLQSRDNSETIYRWFADSADNSSTTSQSIAVGTGTISFDTSGNFNHTSNATVTVSRDGYPAINPLLFNLDFSKITALATSSSSLAVSRQDGFAPGTLSSYIVGEDGKITGVFSNGANRDLGQIRLSRFANPAGLEQRGKNLYAAGVDSGLAVEGNPGQRGIGSVVAGAEELSNTDVGTSLISLVLGSTMYRGNARVITTVEQMFDELLAMLK
jgi:flagellar hook protein FlgE